MIEHAGERSSSKLLPDGKNVTVTKPKKRPGPQAWAVPQGWSNFIEEFRLELRAEGQSPKTVGLRVDHLKQLARELGAESPWQVDARQLVGWCGIQDWAKNTRRSRYGTYRKFWGWGVSSGYTAVDAAAKLPAVGSQAPNPQPTPWVEYRRALATANARERLMMRLSGEIGMRRGEVAQAHSRDVHTGPDGKVYIYAHGKGGKVRVLPVTESLHEEIRTFGAGYFFPGQYGMGHLTESYVGKLVARRLSESTMHKLRHMFGTRAYDNCRDLLKVMTLLGHTRPETTMAYVVPNMDGLHDLVEVTSYTK